jgi:hypothetical protein
VFETSAVVGTSVPHGAGAVLSSQVDDDRVTVAFFGDSASNEGVVFETLNMAAIWDLPIVFLCENNQYAVSTSSDYSVPTDNISDRAAAFDIPGKTIDGQDVLTVYDEVSEAVAAARNREWPQFVEVLNLRTPLPLDEEAVLNSVEKTGRVVVVDTGNRMCGTAAEVAARIANKSLFDLDAPIKRVTRADAPVSYSEPEEAEVLPDQATISQAVEDVLLPTFCAWAVTRSIRSLRGRPRGPRRNSSVPNGVPTVLDGSPGVEGTCVADFRDDVNAPVRRETPVDVFGREHIAALAWP